MYMQCLQCMHTHSVVDETTEEVDTGGVNTMTDQTNGSSNPQPQTHR